MAQARHARRTPSNLGINGMHCPEDTYVSGNRPGQNGARPSNWWWWKPAASEMCMEDSAMGTVRAIYWHGLQSVFGPSCAAFWRRNSGVEENYFYRHILWAHSTPSAYDADVFFLSKTLSVGRGLEMGECAPWSQRNPRRWRTLANVRTAMPGTTHRSMPSTTKQWGPPSKQAQKNRWDRLSITRASQDELHDKTPDGGGFGRRK